MSHPDTCFDPDNSLEDDMSYDDYEQFDHLDSAPIEYITESEYDSDPDDDGDYDSDYDIWDEDDESMDGDHDSAMTSAGWGTDEDYGHYGDDIDAFHDYYGEDF